MITNTFLGRCLRYGAPTDRDHLRLPSEAVAGATGTQPVSRADSPLDPDVIPAPSWRGSSTGSLANLLRETRTTTFVAAHDGKVVCEWYAPDVARGTIHRNLSVTKSIASLLVGQAISAGRLPSVETQLGELVPGLSDPSVARLQLEQLLRMASGISYREGPFPWTDDARVYYGTHLRDQAPHVRITDPVDRFFHYNDWYPLLLAIALEHGTGMRVAQWLQQELWNPIGAGPATMTLDREGGLAHLDSGLNCSAEDLLRVGQLVLQGGSWNGRQLVPADWLERLRDPQGCWRSPTEFRYYARRPWGRPLSTGRYGYKDFWWHHWPREGVHDVFAMGALGAHVYISPDTRCVIVRQSSRFPRGVWWAGMLRKLVEQFAQS